MTEKIKTILEDEREIMRIDWDDGEGSHHDIRSSCAKIVAYGEPAQYCNVPWFAVYNYNGDIIARVPAGHVTVTYK